MTNYEQYVYETETREFDPAVEPTEMECNTCGWRGCPSSNIAICGGETREELHCPRCRKYIEASEWNLVGADPFDVPLDEGEPEIERARRAPISRQQGELFEGVA